MGVLVQDRTTLKKKKKGPHFEATGHSMIAVDLTASKYKRKQSWRDGEFTRLNETVAFFCALALEKYQKNPSTH